MSNEFMSANGMHNLHLLSNAKSRSVSPENFTGEKGKGGMATTGTGQDCALNLGQGWKVSPSVIIQPEQEFVMCDIEGPGVINHIWMTIGQNAKWRNSILRMYWDDMKEPSVECPVGDFFACGWEKYVPISSLAVCVNPGRAFNCYWQMPFGKKCKITMENRNNEDIVLYYQIDYSLQEVPESAAYFHAQFRRVNPLPYKDVYTILDDVKGKGHYVGTYMAWGVNSCGWWGEGEIKFYMDGDKDFPTICGTGTEDYFCGAYNFENKEHQRYEEYTTPYAGLPQVIRPNGLYDSQTRFGMYRWHITDPIRFDKDLKITIQALGWRAGWKYMPLQDDIASVAYWYQTLPHVKFPELLSKEFMEVY